MTNKQDGKTDLKLIEAVRRNDISMVKSLVAQNCLTHRNISDALCIASGSGFTQIVQILISTGADFNAHFGDGTALTEAVHGGHLEVAQILIGAGADTSLPEYGEVLPPLSIAAKRGDFRMVEFLVQVGANVNQIVGSGSSAIDVAAGGGHKEIFDYYPC
jgi:uncharacterized protein